MRKYLSTLHKRSDTHKKNFAFAVSGGTTLMIFAIWTLVNFGHGGVLAQDDSRLATNNSQLVAASAQGTTQVGEVSPLQSIGASVSSTFGALGRAWGELKNSFRGLSDFDLNATYEEMKERTINTYGGE